MKGGKDEEKVMGPLFPRLHVNDTEKRGPRAPPRNKMALYEQLSVPSQRFNSSSSTLPLPLHHTTALVPSTSSSQGGDHERNVFSAFYIPPSTPANSAEKFHSHSSDGMNFTGRMEFGRKYMKNGSYKSSNATGHLLSTADCCSTRPQDISNSKNSSGKKSADDDDFRVPTFHQGGERGRLNPFPIYPGQSANGQQKSIPTNCNPSNQLQNSGDKPLKWTKIGLKSKAEGRNLSEQSPIETVPNKLNKERATSHSSVVERIPEASENANVFSVDKHASVSTNKRENSHTENSQLCQETSVGLLSENNIGADVNSVESRGASGNGISEKLTASSIQSESGSRASLGNSHRDPTTNAEICMKESEDKAQLGNVDRNDDESDTSMVDSIAGLDISPDDVVGAIGQKHFWKARRAIVNQQRVFAVQVFELHRLIKVQRLMAGSPDLLHENNPYVGRPLTVPTMKPTSNYSLKSQQQVLMQKDDSPKPSQDTDCSSSKDGTQKPSIPLVDGVDKGLVRQNSSNAPYSGSIQTAAPSADNNASPWCFPLPGNQWLVPIMSPSEGLVYKPFMGPCPPNIRFMTPVYGGRGPLSLPPIPGYGIPASHQQPGVGFTSGAHMVPQSCFPPAYGLPVMNPIISNSAVEQGNQSADAQPQQQAKQVSTRDVNFNMHSRSSCNMTNQKSEAFSCCVRKVQTSKESEIQGSTASSPCEKAREAGNIAEHREGRDALSLFPVGSTMEGSDVTPQVHGGDRQTHVIKVVPHNARSATESAARIFRSIQKERQHTTRSNLN